MVPLKVGGGFVPASHADRSRDTNSTSAKHGADLLRSFIIGYLRIPYTVSRASDVALRASTSSRRLCDTSSVADERLNTSDERMRSTCERIVSSVLRALSSCACQRWRAAVVSW